MLWCEWSVTIIANSCVYVYALVKAQGLRFFGFALLGTVMAFNGTLLSNIAVSFIKQQSTGVYTTRYLSYLGISEPTFSPPYLQNYIESYCWGAAIVITVNLLVFPISSERQFRSTLVTSLYHVSTLLHLLSKTYTLDITEEEKKSRDMLSGSIRRDFAELNARLSKGLFFLRYINAKTGI